MCKAKWEANYYRCEWNQDSTSVFLNRLADAGAEVVASSFFDGTDPTTSEGWSEIGSLARIQVAEAITEVLGHDSDVTKRRRAASAFNHPLSHLLCCVAAAIGEACALLGTVTSDLSKELGSMVNTSTGSRLAGKLAEVATKRLLNLATSTPFSASEVGFLADTAAVGACPAQQEGGNAANHPEVVRCVDRLIAVFSTEIINTFLDELKIPN